MLGQATPTPGGEGGDSGGMLGQAYRPLYASTSARHVIVSSAATITSEGGWEGQKQVNKHLGTDYGGHQPMETSDVSSVVDWLVRIKNLKWLSSGGMPPRYVHRLSLPSNWTLDAIPPGGSPHSDRIYSVASIPTGGEPAVSEIPAAVPAGSVLVPGEMLTLFGKQHLKWQWIRPDRRHMAGRIAVRVKSVPRAAKVPAPGEQVKIKVILQIEAVRIWLVNDTFDPAWAVIQDVVYDLAEDTPLAAIYNFGQGYIEGWRHERIWRATELLTALAGEHVPDTPGPVEETNPIE